MATPVMSKLQKKLSLSGKKPKREIIKNVLTNPHENYWPRVSEELTELIQVLQENLPVVKSKKVNVPWHIIKNVAKVDRIKARKAYLEQNNISIEKIRKDDNIVFGLNDVTKCLECNSCSAVLVADVRPPLLVQHVLDLTVMHNVPALVVPRMREVMKPICGLESIALAITRDIKEDSNAYKVMKVVTEISKNYPFPSHINLNRNKLISKTIIESETEVKTKKTNHDKVVIPDLKYHLYRTSPHSRVFVPEDTNNATTSTGNFLSFEPVDTIDLTNTSMKEKVSKYRPLIVKRLKGNKNRQKDKLENVKRKRKK